MSFYDVAHGPVNLYMHLAFRIRYQGQENIPKSGGYLMVCNHRSAYDPLFLVTGVRPKICFMAKEELVRIPVLGPILKALGVFGVRRGKGDTSAVDAAVDLVKGGSIVGIFPEGTRAPVGTTLRPKSGAAHIAHMCHADVLPCCVSFQGKLRFRKTVTVCFGRLIPYDALGLEAEGTAGLRSATRVIWNENVLPLLQGVEGVVPQLASPHAAALPPADHS